MPTLLHLADLHLGWRPPDMSVSRGRERQLRRDLLLVQAIDLAIADRVDLVLIAGDLFDQHDPDGDLVESALGHLRRLVEAGIALVTVPGVHDSIAYPTSVYRVRGGEWPGTLVQGTGLSSVLSLVVGGLSVQVVGAACCGEEGSAIALPACREEADVRIAVLHARVAPGPAGWRGGTVDEESLEASGLDYVALGSSHQREIRRLGRTTVVSPGLVESMGFEAPGVSCLTMARVEPGGVEVLSHPIVTQPVFSLVVDTHGLDLGECEASIRRLANPEALVRIVLQGGGGGRVDAERLGGALTDAFFHVEVVDATELPEEARLAGWASEPTILGEFVRRMQGRLASAASSRERRLVERALRRGIEALLAETGS